MSADITTTLASWSTTESSNSPSGATAISTNLDDNLRMLQAVTRTIMSSGTIASAATTDLSTVNDTNITVSGTATITSFGTVSAGIRKNLIFSGACTLTHNGTSLILPGGVNIVCVAGDTAEVVSLGSGNWRCLSFEPVTVTGTGGTVKATSPTLVTPTIGVATATSVNKLAFTQPATGATLTLVEGSTLATSGAYSTTLTATGATNVTLPTTGTLSTLAGSEELTNKTLNASAAKGIWTAPSTWTLPALTLGGNVASTGNPSLNIGTGALTAGSANLTNAYAIDVNHAATTGAVYEVLRNTNGAVTNGATYIGCESTAGGSLVSGSAAYDTILTSSVAGRNVWIGVNNTGVGKFSSTGLSVTGTLSASGITSVTDATDATSTTAASLKTAGGLGVAKNIVQGATYKYYLDGGGNTYLSETSADNVDFYVGGGRLLNLAYNGAANTVGIGGAAVNGYKLTTNSGTSDDTLYRHHNMIGGGGSAASHICTQTTTGITTAKAICGLEHAAFIMVKGSDGGGNEFFDLLVSTNSGTPTVLHSVTTSGAPSARTYSIASYNLRVAMAAGTYTTNCTWVQLVSR